MLIKWLKNCAIKPHVFISASAIGFYGSHDKTPLDEQAIPHKEFSHILCNQWESAALTAKKLGIRTCITRFGVVLGRKGGALNKMLPAFKLGLGGQLGDGQQFFSWVHLEDACRAICFLLENHHLKGAFNVTAPNAVTNQVFTQTLATVLHRPACFNVPAWIIRAAFGEMGDTLLLKGQHVIPQRLQEAGFNFDYALLRDALAEILMRSDEK